LFVIGNLSKAVGFCQNFEEISDLGISEKKTLGR